MNVIERRRQMGLLSDGEEVEPSKDVPAGGSLSIQPPQLVPPENQARVPGQTIVEALKSIRHLIGRIATETASVTAVARERHERWQRERGVLETKLILSRRETLAAYQHADWVEQRTDQLEAANAQLVRTNASLVNANTALQGLFCAAVRGTLCMHEEHAGIVTRVVDDEVVVRFETADGPVEQVYSRGQFIEDQMPADGDRVEARVFLWRRTHSSRGVEHAFSSEEIEAMKQTRGRRPDGVVEF